MANIEHVQDRVISSATLATILIAAVVVLAAVWLRSGLIGSEHWPVRWLDVEGELARTSASQIRSAALGPASRGFFATDLSEVRTEIEALPWVASAGVSRHWPDALSITVTEHRPIARWNETALFSDRGEVFEADGSQNMQGLARLSGPEARRDEVLENWQTMRRRLAGVGQDLQELAVDQRGAWTAVLDNGMELKLGRELIDQRLGRFVQVHEELRTATRRVARVDLRYTNGLAIRWADESTGEAEPHG
ncbi:MAG: FtsQ-type POTRA domain-containing protein [Wenzhouxiangella sp.]|nr:MAG: FtsQ-type POTRA domain-containing protein [Wenzhouxiangella sp.]